MKIHSEQTVVEAAYDRVRWIFDEFPTVVVGFSGGKDSTVCLHIALDVAREKGRLPLPVMFIDQEAEWQGTIDYVEKVMTRPDVKPYWFQMPMVITNNASSYERYSHCWEEGKDEDWIHPKHPISIKENRYGTQRFHDLFEKIMKVEWPEKACYIAGMRTEEAPKRYIAMTQQMCYKGRTWGKKLNTKLGHYTLYPIYDWSYTDVWKFIHDRGEEYCHIYDEMYRHGTPLQQMRISNVHHETAVQTLLLIQEIEPDTWNRVAHRIPGANTVGQIKESAFRCPKELPYMFESWKEYAQHLADNIIQDEDMKAKWHSTMNKDGELYDQGLIADVFWRSGIETILSSDWDWTKHTNWKISASVDTFRRYHNNPGNKKPTNKWIRPMLSSMNFLHPHEQKEVIEYWKNESDKYAQERATQNQG